MGDLLLNLNLLKLCININYVYFNLEFYYFHDKNYISKKIICIQSMLGLFFLGSAPPPSTSERAAGSLAKTLPGLRSALRRAIINLLNTLNSYIFNRIIGTYSWLFISSIFIWGFFSLPFNETLVISQGFLHLS